MDLFDKPSYSEDRYAAKFLNGISVFPNDARIFHQVGYEYDDVVAPGRVTFDGQALKMNLTYLSGAPGVLSIVPVMPGVLRIQVGAPGAKFDETSPMLASPMLSPAELAPLSEERPGAKYDRTNPMLVPLPEERLDASFEDLGSTCSYTFCDYRLEIARSPFCLRVIDPAGAVIFESETEELVGLPTAPPLGLRRKRSGGAVSGGAASGEAWAFLSWRMRNGERFFGLGERFTRFEKTGTRATIWSEDTCGSNTTDMSYKAVPVLFSTAGWALMLHSSFRSYWEVGSFSYATGGMLVEDDKLDLFLILAPELKQQVMAYTALTGRPAMPPRWSFGLWMSRAAYTAREQMLEVANRLRAEQIPCDVFNIDPSWMEHGYYNDIGVEVCNFNWNAPAWGAAEPLFAEFAGLGFAICLWINPYFSEDSPAYAEAKQKGYLVKTTTGAASPGAIARLEFGLAAGIIDFTNPQAKAWWQGKLIDLLQKGASVFKVDFGDRVPENALFANGRTGREMHNLFVHLYAQAVFEATAQVKGEGLVWRRPGYIGTQRYPGCWAGDTQVTWEGMAGALRGGLSAAFTGDSFWSHDIGGFVGQKPADELYIRWVQFGMLSPFSRFHGTTPREPWFYADPAMEVVRHYAQLRYAMMPYLLAYGRESTDTGMPLLRPMVLEFPHEPRIDAIDDQYLLGPDLLVAPVMKEGARSRVIYLPKGQWWSFDRPGVVLSGPGFREVEAPLERVPLYVRAGAVIPHYRNVPQHLKGPAPKEWRVDIYPGDSQRHLVIGEPGYTVKIDYTNEGGTGKLEISPAPVTLAVRLVDRRPTFLRAGEGTRLQPGDNSITFILDATPGASVTFKA